MGFIDKMKSLFTEEEEIIEPVKKEVMQVEIKAPAPQEKIESEPMPVMEEKVEEPVKPAPVFFDDADFANLEPPKRKTPRIEKKNESAFYHENQMKTPKKVFQPSPIISPVYGVLDKNYKSEDIVNKRDRDFASSYYQTSKEMTVDEVRKKAFGTLEDEIDLNLEHKELVEEAPSPAYENQSLESDIFDEMDTTGDSEAVIDNSDDEITLGNTQQIPTEELIEAEEDNLVEEHMEEPKEAEEEKEELDESDLFNLIDSMYEKRDEQ